MPKYQFIKNGDLVFFVLTTAEKSIAEFLKGGEPEVKAEPTSVPELDNEPEWDDFLAACKGAGIDNDCIRLLDAEKDFF